MFDLHFFTIYFLFSVQQQRKRPQESSRLTIFTAVVPKAINWISFGHRSRVGHGIEQPHHVALP
jgi:hypothetical protein